MTNEAFSRVKIDAQLRDQGWEITNTNAVGFEYVLLDRTKTDYVLCDRSVSVGLRAYSGKTNILSKQTLSRGLRRMSFGSDLPSGTLSHARSLFEVHHFESGTLSHAPGKAGAGPKVDSL